MNILAIAVHPDDETLGCGGTLLRHIADGDQVHWLLMTAAHPPRYSDVQIRRQIQQVEAIAVGYPFASIDWLKLPTTELDKVPVNELINHVRLAVQRVKPEVVYVPNRSDVHSDHRVVSQAIQAVLKAFHQRILGVRRILACEVLSETDAAAALPEYSFLPTVYVDVTNTIDRKVELMSFYETELQSEPLPRSASAIRALARYRGSSVGYEFAEAFMLLREVL